LPPRAGNITPPLDHGTLGAAMAFGMGTLLRIADGKVEPVDVEDFRRAGGAWVVVVDDNAYQVLNADGQVLAELDGNAAFRLQQRGRFLIDASGDSPRIMGPGFSQAVTLPARQTPGATLADDILTLTQDGQTVGLLTSSGRLYTAADGAQWAARVTSAERHG